jgi:hypothetical protein
MAKITFRGMNGLEPKPQLLQAVIELLQLRISPIKTTAGLYQNIQKYLTKSLPFPCHQLHHRKQNCTATKNLRESRLVTDWADRDDQPAPYP